ncbi:MAG: transposase [Candidatus Omnitrophota bacterium]
MGDIRRYKEDGYIYFITTNTYSNKGIFLKEKPSLFLKSIISYYRFVFRFKLYTYCIMPDHIHMLIQPLTKQYDISTIMKEIKGTFAREYNIMIRKRGDIWQRKFYDSIIRDEESLLIRINYTFENPVRKGIVNKATEYKFSSARSYILGEEDYVTDRYN